MGRRRESHPHLVFKLIGRVATGAARASLERRIRPAPYSSTRAFLASQKFVLTGHGTVATASKVTVGPKLVVADREAAVKALSTHDDGRIVIRGCQPRMVRGYQSEEH